MKFLTLVLGSVLALDAQQAPSLKIVVLEGEGAVNIIQQKTAVRPLVEVRDRNNLPVAGASVTFSIGGSGSGAAFAGGVQTLTVTTNAAGQAAASGLNALGSGAFQIQVQAAYQGQIATAAISQTNFATAAAAAQAGAGAGGGGGATGAAGGAAGGGGGVSATTIGIIGAAVGGGALAATQVLPKRSDEVTFDIYNGSLSGQLALISSSVNVQGQTSTCTRNHTVTGSLTIDLFEGNATGRAATQQIAFTEVSVTGTCIPATSPITISIQRDNTPVSGGPSALTFRHVATFVNGTTYTVAFTGSHSGNTITGSVSIDVATPAGANPPNLSGSTSFPITLTGPRP
jgi:hypothetical protein